MIPILKYALKEAKRYSCNFNSNMTSNGFLLNEDRIKELTLFNFTGGQITLDGDRQVHNAVRYHKLGEDTYTRIIENIHSMVRNNMTVTLRINCTHENIASLINIPNSFCHFTTEEKKRIRTDLHIVWQEGDQVRLYNEMDKIVEIFKENGLPTAKMEFRGFCYADKRNSCIVNYNGNLYKCSAVDFHKTKRDGYLSPEGDLIWENNSLENRMASKFTNIFCKSCRVMPLCHGGCSKQSLLSKKYCLHNHSEDEKDSIVINRILYNAQFNEINPL